MKIRKVRVGQTYVYEPVLIDKCDSRIQLQPGAVVRVINLHGCPPANTMGHCYVERVNSGEFIGLVCCNSLQPLTENQQTLLRLAVQAQAEDN